MSMPDDLQHAIAVAAAALLQDPQHCLLPIYRKVIYQALDSVTAPHGIGGRARLALITAQQIAPIWQRGWPNDSLIPRLLRVAQDVVRDYMPQHLGWYEAEWAEKTMEGIGARQFPPEQFPALFAGEAVLCALYEISGRRGFDHALLGEQTTDDELDVESSDTARWASIATVGGYNGLPLDKEASRAFWEWWLLVAVPSAWQAD